MRTRTRRRLQVVFAPHLPESSCEFVIRKEGVFGIEPHSHGFIVTHNTHSSSPIQHSNYGVHHPKNIISLHHNSPPHPPSFACPDLSHPPPRLLRPLRRSAAVVVVVVDPVPSPDPEFRLLIGILTLPNRYARRHLLRHVYSLQQPTSPSSVARVDVRFVFCNVTDEVDATLVALEAARYGDVVVLGCDESMNTGKTYTFFASLPDMLDGDGGDGSTTSRRAPYDYVMKTDDDTYFRLDRLVTSLRGQPTEDFYYGAGLPFADPKFPPFMLGMGYILSWDLVEWIATSDIPRKNAVGPEDMLTGKWLNTGNKARNRYNTVPYMYDYKGPTSGDFLVDTIAVHQLKENSRWAHTLKHFNLHRSGATLPPLDSTRSKVAPKVSAMVVHKTQVLPLSSDVPVSAAVTKKPLSEFQLQSFIASCNPIAASSYVGSSDALTTRVTREPDFRLLIGVLTRADLYERRHLLRLVYALQMANLTAHVDVRYVFCRLYKDDQRILVPLEIMQHDDIIILDCEENLNDGKTYTYFSSIAKLYGGGSGAEGGRRPPYDYVMKADDDLFVRLLTLIESLRPMPRDDMYYGAVIPCDSMDPFRDYMSGMGYILSWDLVEWIGSSEAVRNKSAGVEDMLTGEWLRTAGKGKNRFNAKPAMYDFPIPVPIDACSHGFVPDTVAVHRLKDNPNGPPP
uniref:Hexosyltransferase n=1 Tax=Ananas comosus var. bracteatus TaxID=296719 RepID=A0A6V7P4C3_ANACO|nr:unnamed protein product [Ananas comosus var. bracteatus]